MTAQVKEWARPHAIAYGGPRPGIRLIGPGNSVLAVQARNAIRALRQAGLDDLVIDVSQVVDCGGELLRMLAREHIRSARQGAQLTVVGVRFAQFKHVLATATPDEAFVLHEPLRHVPPPSR